MIHTYDVAIIGGGLAGLTTSCLLASSGLHIVCVDQAHIAPGNDARTTVISYGSRKILENAGIWQHLTGCAGVIENIEILDGDSPVLLNFLSSEMQGKSFGWNILNADLRMAMQRQIEAHKNVKHLQGIKVTDFNVEHDKAQVLLANGDSIECALVIGADGRNSFVREWMDIPVRRWDYNQRAIICNVVHENDHKNIAVEHFWPAGPFAILPMADDEQGRHRSSVVFTEHGPKKNSLMNMSDEEFETALAEKFPERYGDVKMMAKRAVFPLSLIHASSYIGPRMALLGDAAHGIHPVAGQGLNLGFRDVKAICELISNAHARGEDVGDEDVLDAYQRARRFDNTAMVAVTDGLVRLFSSRLPGSRILRRAGLKAVAKLPAAKKFFMRQAMGDR